MNEDLKHLKEKKDFGYGDAIRITGAALALMLQIHYKRIAEDAAYNMLKNDLGFDDDAIAWIRADLEKILSKADSEDKKDE